MKDKKPRTYTGATLRTRAFGKLQRVGARIDDLVAAKNKADDKYEARMKDLRALLNEAQTELDAASGGWSASLPNPTAPPGDSAPE